MKDYSISKPVKKHLLKLIRATLKAFFCALYSGKALLRLFLLTLILFFCDILQLFFLLFSKDSKLVRKRHFRTVTIDFKNCFFKLLRSFWTFFTLFLTLIWNLVLLIFSLIGLLVLAVKILYQAVDVLCTFYVFINTVLPALLGFFRPQFFSSPSSLMASASTSPTIQR